MSLNVNRSILAVAEESVEGTAESLVAGDAVLAANIKVTPEVETDDRVAMSASLSPWGKVPGAISGKASFDVEIKGSGAAGTAPEFGLLLQACGFLETVDAGVSVTYTPASSSIPSLTIGHYLDGKRYQLAGCRGTVKFTFEEGKIVKASFEFTGTSYTETDAALLSGVSYDSTIPRPFLDASFALDSYAAIIQQMEIDMGNTVSLRPDANSTGGYISAIISSREPKLTVNPEDVLVATKNWYSTMTAGTQIAMTVTLGSTAGNICTVTAPKAQISSLGNSDRDGTSVRDIEAILCRNSGDDELSIAFT